MLAFKNLLFSSLLFLLFLHLLLPFRSGAVAGAPLYKICNGAGAGAYTANSAYRSNVGLVLSSLVANASGGFSAGVAGRPPDRVSGLALCRGDVNASACSSCLRASAADVLRLCPYDKDAVIWYDYCLIRYSNLHFLNSSSNDLKQAIFLNSGEVVENPHLFNEMVTRSVNTTAAWAAFNTTRRFATSVANSTAELPPIYGLAQCTPDMTAVECWQCLQGLIGEMPSYFNGSKRGWILGVRCSIRYELASFSHEALTLRLARPTVNTLTAPTSAPPQNPPAVVPASEQGQKKKKTVNKGLALAIGIPLAVAFAWYIRAWWMRRRRRRSATRQPVLHETTPEEIISVESLLIDLSTLRAATANFDEVNKLGEGGFGAVYKGILHDGREITVKRLSSSSGQGIEELKSELVLVAKLQHKNLVRLLGVCLEEQEKLLVYEYVPNRSLDTILFDSEKKEQLKWGKRCRIINGIARALMYLHEDSQLKIVHRDLKASNILLDADMNPKISDFGLARLFGVDQTRAVTARVVGTLGYMAPEYVMNGHFSVKSDVFSFGVVMLEILTGRKNTAILHSEHDKVLLTYIWEHWIHGTILEIVDPSLGGDYPQNEALRYIHIGLLCVQEDPAERPMMSTVVVMLNSEAGSHQTPCRPAFCIGHSGIHYRGIGDQSPNKNYVPTSLNDVSITDVEPR